MVTENEELENENLQQEEAPKTLAAFREHLREKFNFGKDDDHDDHDGDDDDGDEKKKKPFDKDKKDDDGDDEKDDKKDGKDEKKKVIVNVREGKRREEEEEEEEGGCSKGKKKKKMEEETQAAATLHPKAVPGQGMSKIEMMKHMVTHMAGLNKTDFTDWFKKSLDRWGPNKDHGVGDNSAKNQASIDSKFGSGPKTKYPMPKLHVREDLEEVLGETGLSEEVLEKTATLFEAAVHMRMVMETERLEEEYVEILAEEIEHFTSSMTEKLDTYLDYVVENWMAENQIAVESALRSEITGEFIEGLKGLFAEHYIDVPEDKVDVLDAMALKVDALETRLESTINENVLLKDALLGGAKQEVIEHVSKELTQSQREKFATLAEGIEFDGDFAAYENKLNIIMENYFSGSAKSQQHSSNILEESFEGEEEEPTTSKYVDPDVNRYAYAISRTVKGNKAVNG